MFQGHKTKSISLFALIVLVLTTIGLAPFQITSTQAAPRMAPQQHPGSITLAQTQAFDPNVYYRIIARHSGKVLDVESASFSNGAWVHQWDYQSLANQQWSITAVGGGYYKIAARHSGKVLDVESASYSNGAVVHQWDYQSLANQQWSITDVGGGYYVIAARHSGKVLDVSRASYSNGAVVHQWDYQSLANQQWRLEVVP